MAYIQSKGPTEFKLEFLKSDFKSKKKHINNTKFCGITQVPLFSISAHICFYVLS